ncbi:MAG TPA: DUF3568 family protein [Gemmataceae bacterium]|nr:DUF3568 family protein [Gemmataceae bacterium]
MAATWKQWATRAALAAVAATALVNAGCLVAAVGAAAGAAGAAGYLYYTAPLVRDYAAPYGDALTAVKTALADLQFQIDKEKSVGGGTLIETHTGDGVSVQITLDLLTNPVPADGSMTRVSVRVGHFGDEEISTRIQDQIAKHVPPPAAPLARPAPPPPVETAPPPLAVPTKK